MISQKLTQLYDEIQTFGRRLDRLEPEYVEGVNGQRPTAGAENPHVGSEAFTGDSVQGNAETSQHNVCLAGKEAKVHRTPLSPTSSIFSCMTVRALYPMVSGRYLREDAMSSAYSAVGHPSVISPSVASIRSQTDTGQVYLHIRNFLDLVYPLCPILCEQAIADMEASVIRNGFQVNLSSALVLLMKTLGKLYSETYDSFEYNNAIANLDSAVRVLNWLPLEYTIEYAQAYTLTALSFAKLSMLSSSAIYLRQASTILYEFLIRCEHPQLGQQTPNARLTVDLETFWCHLRLNLQHAPLASGYIGCY